MRLDNTWRHNAMLLYSTLHDMATMRVETLLHMTWRRNGTIPYMTLRNMATTLDGISRYLTQHDMATGLNNT